MLRITSTTELRFRQKESVFTKNFGYGFALALAIHLLLFFMFRIAHFFNLDDLKPHPPIAVEIDLGKCAIDTLSVQITYSPLEPLAMPEFFEKAVESLQLQWQVEDPFELEKREISFPDFSELERIEWRGYDCD